MSSPRWGSSAASLPRGRCWPGPGRRFSPGSGWRSSSTASTVRSRDRGLTERLPRFSGERLDLVIDYVTYVFVPALALMQAGYLQGRLGLLLASLILLSSLFHFSDTQSKTEDHCFVGFPAVWNIVAFYIFAFQMPPWAAGALVLVCVSSLSCRWHGRIRCAPRFCGLPRSRWPHCGASPPRPRSGEVFPLACRRRPFW